MIDAGWMLGEIAVVTIRMRRTRRPENRALLAEKRSQLVTAFRLATELDARRACRQQITKARERTRLLWQ